MSIGLGRFNAQQAKIKYISKKAEEKNKELGFTEDYFDRFERDIDENRYFPQEKKKEPLFDPS